MIDPRNIVLTDVTAVLPDRLLPGATIVIRDGVIVEVADGVRSGVGVVDGHGVLCMPGIVDTHSDALEKELRPRPGVILPTEFALHSFEGRALAAGVTTMFHGVGFEENGKYDRSVAQAVELCAVIDRRAAGGRAILDHHVLHRLDVRDADGLAALVSRLDSWVPADRVEPLPLVSYEDHTPGQGQYTDRSWFERYIAGTRSITMDEAARVVDEVIAERDSMLGVRERAIEELGRRAVAGEIRLMAHDPTDADEIVAARGAGMTIAEFPTTVAAARAAREVGMRTVSGGPNALRGTSHSGNVSARELIAAGLCDGLASDYLPSTLIGSMAAMVDAGVCDLPTGVALVTSGPADTVGLVDRGRLAVGQRADLVLLDLVGAMPTVRFVVSQATTAAVRDAALTGAAR
ncbi:MAG: hypothetical protein RLZZ01_2105 [Actinomycetota bacterium]